MHLKKFKRVDLFPHISQEEINHFIQYGLYQVAQSIIY